MEFNIGNITKKIICLAERDSFIFLEPTYVKELKKLLNKWLYRLYKSLKTNTSRTKKHLKKL